MSTMSTSASDRAAKKNFRAQLKLTKIKINMIFSSKYLRALTTIVLPLIQDLHRGSACISIIIDFD
jgi:hypothetical protein